MPKQIQEFVISALRIHPNCKPSLRKVLKDEYYLFNKRCVLDDKRNLVLNPCYIRDYNIYGTRLSINTIVGKNGSGKSSILEMIYRIVNNFSSLLVRDTKRGASYPLYFIDGLWADLYYVIDNGEEGPQLACLSCQGDRVTLSVNNDYVFPLHLYERGKKWTQATIAEHWDKLFYNIVTNYSVQSFISTDFENEVCYRVGPDGYSGQRIGLQWMSNLFHKNDGYLTPIVLNPYRDKEGNMNADVERKITISRLMSILVFFKEHNANFLDGYKLHDIRFHYDPGIVVEKYVGDMDDDLIADSVRKSVGQFAQVMKKPETYASIILTCLGFYNLEMPDALTESAAAYLVYKVLAVAKKYPTYNKYKITDGPALFDQEVDLKDRRSLILLVQEIIKDKSHITLKIRQAQRFLRQYNPKKDGAAKLNYSFSFYEYQDAIGDSVSAGGLYSIMEQIPPPFFIPTINFYKVEKGKVIEEDIPISKMSSGERQYLYNFSTIIYHMRNLLSIQDSQRVRYRAIHLVFDEVEICFHPEYQRRFINSLLSILTKTRLSSYCAIQITIATHSPFILSDVPQQSILYLEDGSNVSEQITVNPFGANINDVLQQSFFLDNGFVGEFAQKKINSLVNYLKFGTNKNEWNRDSASFFIDNLVGEPIIKNLLKELLKEKQSQNEKDSYYQQN